MSICVCVFFFLKRGKYPLNGGNIMHWWAMCKKRASRMQRETVVASQTPSYLKPEQEQCIYATVNQKKYSSLLVVWWKCNFSSSAHEISSLSGWLMYRSNLIQKPVDYGGVNVCICEALLEHRYRASCSPIYSSASLLLVKASRGEHVISYSWIWLWDTLMCMYR